MAFHSRSQICPYGLSENRVSTILRKCEETWCEKCTKDPHRSLHSFSVPLKVRELEEKILDDTSKNSPFEGQGRPDDWKPE